MLKATKYIWVVAFLHIAYVGYWHCHQCAVPFAPVQWTASQAQSRSVSIHSIASPQCSPCVTDCVLPFVLGRTGGEQGIPIAQEVLEQPYLHIPAVEEPAGLRSGIDPLTPRYVLLVHRSHGRRAPPYLAYTG